MGLELTKKCTSLILGRFSGILCTSETETLFRKSNDAVGRTIYKTPGPVLRRMAVRLRAPCERSRWQSLPPNFTKQSSTAKSMNV